MAEAAQPTQSSMPDWLTPLAEGEPYVSTSLFSIADWRQWTTAVFSDYRYPALLGTTGEFPSRWFPSNEIVFINGRPVKITSTPSGTSLPESVADFAARAALIGRVTAVYWMRDEGELSLLTVLDAEPFDDSPRAAVYGAELETRSRFRLTPLRFRLTNLREGEPSITARHQVAFSRGRVPADA